jgi:hypothetical protein
MFELRVVPGDDPLAGMEEPIAPISVDGCGGRAMTALRQKILSTIRGKATGVIPGPDPFALRKSDRRSGRLG